MVAPSQQKRDPRTSTLAYSLWFLTAVLSVFSFIAARELIIRIYVRFFPSLAFQFQQGQQGYSLLNTVVSMSLGIMLIAIVIAGFEYQYRNLGKPRAWRFLTRTLAVEAGILLLAFFL